MQLYTKILIGMVVGVIAGLLVGPNSSLLPQDGVYIGELEVREATTGGDISDSVHPLSVGLSEARLTGSDTLKFEGVDWVEVSWSLTGSDRLRL